MPVNRASKLTLKVSNRSNVSLRIEEPLASAGGFFAVVPRISRAGPYHIRSGSLAIFAAIQ